MCLRSVLYSQINKQDQAPTHIRFRPWYFQCCEAAVVVFDNVCKTSSNASRPETEAVRRGVGRSILEKEQRGEDHKTKMSSI